MIEKALMKHFIFLCIIAVGMQIYIDLTINLLLPLNLRRSELGLPFGGHFSGGVHTDMHI